MLRIWSEWELLYWCNETVLNKLWPKKKILFNSVTHFILHCVVCYNILHQTHILWPKSIDGIYRFASIGYVSEAIYHILLTPISNHTSKLNIIPMFFSGNGYVPSNWIIFLHCPSRSWVNSWYIGLLNMHSYRPTQQQLISGEQLHFHFKCK